RALAGVGRGDRQHAFDQLVHCAGRRGRRGSGGGRLRLAGGDAYARRLLPRTAAGAGRRRGRGLARGNRVVVEARVIARAVGDHFHPPGAAVADADLDRGGITEVDDAPVVEGAAVVDSHHHRLAVVEVGHPREARQRQRLVRGGEGVHVVHLQVGGTA